MRVAENWCGMKLFGIKTCDTCRRALKELAAAGKAVDFVDVRAAGLDDETLRSFRAAFGDKLVNRSSATWRGLSEEERSRDPFALIAENPTLMKRPVIEDHGRLWLGWGPQVRGALLG